MVKIVRYPLSILGTLLLWWLCLFPVPSNESLPRFEGIDKVVHFLMYFCLCLAMWWEYLKQHPTPSRRALYCFTLALPFAMGIAIEVAQAWLTTYRSGDAYDALCNLLGIIGAAVVGKYLLIPLISHSQDKQK